jgi:signal transduction histidine kinase
LLDYFYYTALAVAALYGNATADQQNRWRDLLTAHREQLREWAEEELRRSEAYLAQGERIGHTASWGWQVATGSVYWSKEHFCIFAYDPQTTRPTYALFMERIHPEDRGGFEATLHRAVRDQRDFDYDYRIVLPGGSIKFLRSVGHAVVNPSGALEFMGTVMDISELKRAEEATQASLAIQLTRLAKTARQSAVLEERNQLAGEIHDSLAQFFTGIAMQLGAAKEVVKTGGDNGLSYVERATELAQIGLAEARRSAFSIQSTIIEESGLIDALQKLVERANVPGRLRCNFHATGVPEEGLPAQIQHELLRICQEAISNAVRHAKPTVVTVTLRWDRPNLILEVKDNGSGMSSARLEKRDGVGLGSMRHRVAQIGAKLEIQTAAGRGTSIIVTVPISLPRCTLS